MSPADNPWNRNVSYDPSVPKCANNIASIGAAVNLHPDFGSNPTCGVPQVVVPSTKPFVPITFTAWGDQSDPGPYPVPSNAPVDAATAARARAPRPTT